MAEVSLSIKIAGRVYPLTIKKGEEQFVLNSEKMINEKMKEIEQNYALHDKQDLLAMSAINIITNLQTIPKSQPELEKEINQLDLFISEYLQKESIA